MLAALLLLTAPAPGAPTLAQVEALPPQRAGELLLKGKAHAPIVSARRKVERYIGVPGQTDYELIEAARAIPGGCVRRRWTATFQSAGGGEGDAVFSGVYSKTEVAVPLPGCARARYASLNGGVDSARALDLLRALHRIGTGATPVRFDCRSEIDPRLCTGPRTMRAAIRTTPVWAISESAGVAEYWLGEPGGVVTTVKMNTAQPGAVTITREIPPPF